MKLRVKEYSLTIFGRFRAFFKSRTIDSEHIIGMGYVLAYLLPFLINSLVFAILSLVLNYIPLSNLTIPFGMFLINGVLLIKFTKRIIALVKEKRILLPLILIYIVFSFLLATIFWFGSIFLSLTVIMTHLFPDNTTIAELTAMVRHYSENYQQMIASFKSNARLAIPILQTLGLSYFLNLFIPKKYQNIDVPAKNKFFRILLKIGFLILPAVLFIIFSKIDKNSYPIIAGVGLLIIWFSKPQNIIGLISLSVNITDEDVKPEILNKVKILKLFLTSIEVSWGISIFCFYNYNSVMRFYITSGILCFSIFLLIIWQIHLKSHKEEWINKTLKENVAKKVLDKVNTKR